jgi:hypothetical protein
VPVLLLLVVADAALRFHPTRVDKLRQLITAAPDDRVYMLRPGAVIPFDGMFGRLAEPIVWSISDQGYREDRLVAPQTRRFRVAAYGDSETFGWSVSQERTFQRRMEARDDRIEVVNLGVPGYNAANIARHMEATFDDVRPDAIVYLVNRNDVDEPLTTTRTIADSPVLRRLRFLWQMTVAKPARLRARHSPERARFFAGEAERIAAFGAEHDVPVVFGFLRWKTRRRIEPFTALEAREVVGGERAALDPDVPLFVNVQARIEGDPEEDAHMTSVSHEKIADLLCQVLSGEAGSGCVPSSFSSAHAALRSGVPSPSSKRS